MHVLSQAKLVPSVITTSGKGNSMALNMMNSKLRSSAVPPSTTTAVQHSALCSRGHAGQLFQTDWQKRNIVDCACRSTCEGFDMFFCIVIDLCLNGSAGLYHNSLNSSIYIVLQSSFQFVDATSDLECALLEN